MAARSRKRKSTNPKKLAAGTIITFEEPKSGRKPKPSTAKVVVQEINPVTGFVDFLRTHAIVGLSIGFIIGNQMSAFVKVIVTNFIDPLSQLLFGKALSLRTFTLHFHHRAANFGWGALVYSLLNVILLLIFIYLFIKFFHLGEFDKPKEEE
jgi:large-conductance mechanosensitive channel